MLAEQQPNFEKQMEEAAVCYPTLRLISCCPDQIVKKTSSFFLQKASGSLSGLGMLLTCGD